MGLTLKFIPYSEIDHYSGEEKLHHLLNIVKEDKIILLEGRLKKDEEKQLITMTMSDINEKFRGIELSVINPNSSKSFVSSIKSSLVNLMIGDRTGFTIIGPANIVKEIKNDPDKIELLTSDSNFNGKKKKK